MDAEHRDRVAVLSLTHSPVAVGMLAVCQFLPFTVFGLFAGVIVDRFDARRAGDRDAGRVDGASPRRSPA